MIKTMGNYDIMTTIFNLRGTFLLSSIYDGQSYYSRENTLEEAKYLENKKCQKFIENGCDIEAYEEKYYQLVEERRNRSVNEAKNIWEREKIALLYNQKINDLAKEYLDVDFDIVT